MGFLSPKHSLTGDRGYAGLLQAEVCTGQERSSLSLRTLSPMKLATSSAGNPAEMTAGGMISGMAAVKRVPKVEK